MTTFHSSSKKDRAQEVFGMPPKWLIRANSVIVSFIILASISMLILFKHQYSSGLIVKLCKLMEVFK